MFSLRKSPSEKVEIVISVSKKVAPKAVVRNTIKRRVRAVLREMKLTRAKYLFIALRGSESLRGEDLKRVISKLI